MWFFNKKRYLRFQDRYDEIREMRIISETDRCYFVKGTIGVFDRDDSYATRKVRFWLKKDDILIIDVDGGTGRSGTVYKFPTAAKDTIPVRVRFHASR